jgi:hypothetical protein
MGTKRTSIPSTPISTWRPDRYDNSVGLGRTESFTLRHIGDPRPFPGRRPWNSWREYSMKENRVFTASLLSGILLLILFFGWKGLVLVSLGILVSLVFWGIRSKSKYERGI